MNSLRKLMRGPLLLQHLAVTQFTSCRGHRISAFQTLRELKRRQDREGFRPENHRNTYLEWNYKAELYSFGKRIGEQFDDSLLRRALTERSYLIKKMEEMKNVGIETNEVTDDEHNASMAVRGQDILENFAQIYLRHVLPRFPEEGIQSIKRYLSSDKVLSHVAFHIGTSELILCNDFPAEEPTLAKVMKALIAALHDSSGLERTSLFIRDVILTQIAELDINDLWTIDDPVGTLKTICRNEGVEEPEARLIGEAGVNTILAVYRVGYFVNRKLIGQGPGEDVKTATEMAAYDSLRRLFATSTHQLDIPFNLVLDPNSKSMPNVSIHEWCETKVQNRLKQAKISK